MCWHNRCYTNLYALLNQVSTFGVNANVTPNEDKFILTLTKEGGVMEQNMDKIMEKEDSL